MSAFARFHLRPSGFGGQAASYGAMAAFGRQSAGFEQAGEL
jgi:hypothetical protein